MVIIFLLDGEINYASKYAIEVVLLGIILYVNRNFISFPITGKRSKFL